MSRKSVFAVCKRRRKREKEYDEKGVMYLTPEQANRFIDFQNEYECESATVKKDLLKEVELRILNAS